MLWILFIGFYFLIDIYAFQAVRTISTSLWWRGGYIVVSIIVLLGLVYNIRFIGTGEILPPAQMYLFGIFLMTFVPKTFLIIFMFGEDVVRFIIGGVRKLTQSNSEFHIPSRRKFISTMVLGIAAIPFFSLLYGMIKGKYDYRVLKYALEFEDLPEEFDGFTITQLSDIHCGSFDNREKVEYAINLTNEQKSDIIVFTGDLVNNVSEELDDWKDLFATLSAPQGVFSILGNHDYGDYFVWDSPADQKRNLDRLKDMQKEMGWDLLLNENRVFEKNGQKIALVGVENWGENGFKKAGDLDKAMLGISDKDFKVLLSHDPSHWKAKVKDDPRNFQLTLSGHTHGMQFGIEIPGYFQWSPVQYQYENWAGIYRKLDRYINVNRGLGYLGYPGRVGIWPEITVIKLKKKRSQSQEEIS